ncbi:hypothetical protein H4R24_003327 [Coemansia sp. RSA 988]|nr:hypothetical protein H4R24_003327 [Coemansia sp. RSA 988]
MPYLGSTTSSSLETSVDNPTQQLKHKYVVILEGDVDDEDDDYDVYGDQTMTSEELKANVANDKNDEEYFSHYHLKQFSGQVTDSFDEEPDDFKYSHYPETDFSEVADGELNEQNANIVIDSCAYYFLRIFPKTD